jgi:stress-induced morphogen
MPIRKRFGFPGKEESYGQVTYAEVVVIHHDVLKSTTSAGRRGAWCATCKNRLVALVHLVYLVRLVCLVKPDRPDKPNRPDKPDQLVPPVSLDYPARSGWSELPLRLALRYSYCHAIGGAMITPDVLTEYLLQMMPDASVTVSDRTGTMDHLKVVVISAAFAGKNLLDRHRLIYQALDGPLKDGRIHALELTARTSDEL